FTVFFFFSSRRRHTRSLRDWSSDVCSSDLPAEFMAALLSSEIGNTDRVVQYINEARELDLQVLAPDVNESRYKFTVVGDQRIRFGLGAVRNVGEGAIASIIAGRQAGHYRSLVELCDRIDLRLCNKRVTESLI